MPSPNSRAAREFGKTWGEAGRRVARHPLAGFGWHGWDGTPFPGNGSSYSPHVQGLDVTQSFRAVWDIGNWDAGGIVIPQGESGEPGSPHYRDLAPDWLSGTLVPLPFSNAAVERAAVKQLHSRALKRVEGSAMLGDSVREVQLARSRVGESALASTIARKENGRARIAPIRNVLPPECCAAAPARFQ